MSNSTFFMPKQINVGFQERNNTFTGNLAYVIYFDENGVLRKETSWNNWRDQSLDNQIFDNEPTEGFVLNKKAGGYSTGWNYRQSYVRVYDPRGFEFEITIPNLLYILENTTSTKGKGLEGKFVYGWEGTDLVLIPCDSPDYIELCKYNEFRHETKRIGAKDVKIGATYLTKNNEELIYMGRFDEHYKYLDESLSQSIATKNAFYFIERGEKCFKLHVLKSPLGKLIACIDEKYVDDYADLFERIEGSYKYSPIDSNKDEYSLISFEEFKNWFSIYGHLRSSLFVNKNEGIFTRCSLYKRNDGTCQYYDDDNIEYIEFNTLNDLFKYSKLFKKVEYLTNGKLYDYTIVC